MPLKLLTPPTASAVTLEEARLHLRVDNDAEDDLILSLIAAAEELGEHLMGRALMPQSWQLTLDEFPCTAANAVTLQRPPVTAITSVKYVAQGAGSAGTLTTLASTEYRLAAASDYEARVVPAYGKTWPATQCQPEAVQIVFACGYTDAAAVPKAIKQWVLLRVAAGYTHRSAWTEGKKLEPNPFLDFLLDRYRTWYA